MDGEDGGIATKVDGQDGGEGVAGALPRPVASRASAPRPLHLPRRTGARAADAAATGTAPPGDRPPRVVAERGATPARWQGPAPAGPGAMHSMGRDIGHHDRRSSGQPSSFEVTVLMLTAGKTIGIEPRSADCEDMAVDRS